MARAPGPALCSPCPARRLLLLLRAGLLLPFMPMRAGAAADRRVHDRHLDRGPPGRGVEVDDIAEAVAERAGQQRSYPPIAGRTLTPAS